MFLVGYEHPTNTKLHRNQDLCTVYDCEKPSIYAGLRLIIITLLRPKENPFSKEGGFFVCIIHY